MIYYNTDESEKHSELKNIAVEPGHAVSEYARNIVAQGVMEQKRAELFEPMASFRLAQQIPFHFQINDDTAAARGGGAGGVYLHTLRTPIPKSGDTRPKPTKVALDRVPFRVFGTGIRATVAGHSERWDAPVQRPPFYIKAVFPQQKSSGSCHCF